jgi:hypothetical protein
MRVRLTTRAGAIRPECLGGLVDRSIIGEDLIDEVDRLTAVRAYPAAVRCDNGPTWLNPGGRLGRRTPSPTPQRARLPRLRPICDQPHPQVKRLTRCDLFGGNRPRRSERLMNGLEGLAAGRGAAVDGDVYEYFLDLTHRCAAG